MGLSKQKFYVGEVKRGRSGVDEEDRGWRG
jgi:hypothetical protein